VSLYAAPQHLHPLPRRYLADGDEEPASRGSRGLSAGVGDISAASALQFPADRANRGRRPCSLIRPKTGQEARLPRYRGNQGRETSAAHFAPSMTSKDPRLANGRCVRDARAETRCHFRTVITSVVRCLVVSRVPRAAGSSAATPVSEIAPASWEQKRAPAAG